MKKASEFHSAGLNCAESMVCAFNEEHGTNYPVSLGSGLGAGVYSGSLCGVVNMSAIIIGLQVGRQDPGQPNASAPLVRQLMQAVREKYGTELCAGLKKNKISCADILDFTQEKLNELLQKQTRRID